MSRIKTTILAFTIVAAFMAVLPADANADGPLRQWLRGLWRPNAGATTANFGGSGGGLFRNCGSANRAVQPTTANFAQTPQTPNVNNLQPGQCMKTCQQTCSRTVVNYVPYTAYRTAYKRVPVTQYRPETNTDPCTGCTVTCMKPCTSYTYQCQRVPYTTYRPVYRQETYKVPVTTITNDCSTGTCAPCNTCNTGSGFANQAPGLPAGNFNPTPAAGSSTTTNFAPAAGSATTNFPPAAGSSTTNFPPAGGSSTTTNFAPQFSNPLPAPTTSTFYEQVPSGTLSPSSGATFGSGTRYNAPVPSTQPSLEDVNPLQDVSPFVSQRPFLDRFNKDQSGGTNRQASALREIEDDAPARFDFDDKTAASPVRKQWGYSPVRTASFNKPTTTRAQLTPINRSRSSNGLNGWKEVN